MKKNTKKLQPIKLEDMHSSVRGTFASYLYNAMIENPDIVLILPDLGYKMFDKHVEDFSDRVFKVGASEQAALGIAVGFAYEGKIPFIYSISPFLYSRGHEWLRNYINRESLPIKMLGSGIDRDYDHDGITHWAEDAEKVLSAFENINVTKATDRNKAKEVLDKTLENNKPYFVILQR